MFSTCCIQFNNLSHPQHSPVQGTSPAETPRTHPATPCHLSTCSPARAYMQGSQSGTLACQRLCLALERLCPVTTDLQRSTTRSALAFLARQSAARDRLRELVWNTIRQVSIVNKSSESRDKLNKANSKDNVSAINNIDTEDISDNDKLFNHHITSLHKTSTLPCSAHQLPPPHPWQPS